MFIQYFSEKHSGHSIIMMVEVNINIVRDYIMIMLCQKIISSKLGQSMLFFVHCKMQVIVHLLKFSYMFIKINVCSGAIRQKVKWV